MEYTCILIEDKYCRKKRRKTTSIYSELDYSSSEYYHILETKLYQSSRVLSASNLLSLQMIFWEKILQEKSVGKSWENWNGKRCQKPVSNDWQRTVIRDSKNIEDFGLLSVNRLAGICLVSLKPNVRFYCQTSWFVQLLCIKYDKQLFDV